MEKLNFQTIIDVILPVLPNTLAIYAFGSQVQNTANTESDLDLAVLVPNYVETLTLWDLSGQLADNFACSVDLLDMRAASTVMQHQILTTGFRLWALDLSVDLLECYVLSEKFNLDHARAGLLADIEATGKVYAR